MAGQGLGGNGRQARQARQAGRQGKARRGRQAWQAGRGKARQGKAGTKTINVKRRGIMKSRITEELKKIASANDGKLYPRAVVDAARPAGSPLHGSFEWDDSVAAESYRIEQARKLDPGVGDDPARIGGDHPRLCQPHDRPEARRRLSAGRDGYDEF